MRGRVKAGRAFGEIEAPASKSFTQRAVACAVLSDAATEIHNGSLCADGLASLQIALGLGAACDIESDVVKIRPAEREPDGILSAGEAGLSMRMFTPIAARFARAITIEAEGSLRRRPLGMMETPLRFLGVRCETTDGLPPIHVHGPLTGGVVDLNGSVTSQFLTGLLIALPGCEKDSLIYVRELSSRPYVKMTLSVLRAFGAVVDVDEAMTRFCIPGGQRFHCPVFDVPGDWSGAAGLLVAGAVGGSVTVTGLPDDDVQADRAILDVLGLTGASVDVSGGRVTVSRDTLRGFQFDASDCPDLVPVLSALATCCAGESRIVGTRRLEYKESDRGAVLQREFGKLGVNITIEVDALVIAGGRPHGGKVSASGDHRIAMALSVAALNAVGPIEIDGVECVAKSYPGFFEDMARLGVKIELES